MPFGQYAADRDLSCDILAAVTDVYQIRDRQPLPAASPAVAHVLIEGWAIRSHILSSGARQITDILVSGDFCSTGTGDEEHAPVEACGPARIAVLDTARTSEQIRTLVEQSQGAQQGEVMRRLRAGLVSLGRRDARERLAYMVAETRARLMRADLVRGGSFTWPFTQEQLADILGLTPVHTNRVLAQLRRENLLVVRGREVEILDLTGLCHMAGFETD